VGVGPVCGGEPLPGGPWARALPSVHPAAGPPPPPSSALTGRTIRRGRGKGPEGSLVTQGDSRGEGRGLLDMSIARTTMRRKEWRSGWGLRELGHWLMGRGRRQKVDNCEYHHHGGRKSKILRCTKLVIHFTVRGNSHPVLSNSGGSPSVLPLVDCPPPTARGGVGTRDSPQRPTPRGGPPRPCPQPATKPNASPSPAPGHNPLATL